MPSQEGRTVVVTGASSGIGLATACALAGAGARVVAACRNVEKARAALAPAGGEVAVRSLDLADLTSVAQFCDELEEPVDVLINNAGVMALPHARTADGFEVHLGTNYLGHFALTGRLLPIIADRVVTLSSLAHRFGRIELDDLNWERRRYRPWFAYAQAKLACLMFAYQLQARLDVSGSDVRSMAAHPGWAATNLMGQSQTVQDPLMRVAARLLAQPAEHGAWPSIYAATDADVRGGSYLGPDGSAELKGRPCLVSSTRASHDPQVQRQLWLEAERLTGVLFP